MPSCGYSNIPRRFYASLAAPALSATLLLVSVCIAAITAHLGIDFFGDYVLAHDDYDGIAHSSRLGAIAGVLWSAFDEARQARAVHRPLIGSPFAFGCAVVALGIGATMGMEWFDAWLDGTSVDGISGALGGSVLLGLGTTVPIAIADAYCAVRIARFIERTRSLLARAIVALATLVRRDAQSSCLRASNNERAPFFCLLAVAHARAHKRGPPLAA